MISNAIDNKLISFAKTSCVTCDMWLIREY